MGTIKQGILGGFNGKVGTVIGSSWKGITYMKGIPTHTRNPRTEKQIAQRTKMEFARNYLSQAQEFLNVGFKDVAKHQSPLNYAASQMMRTGITGDYPDYSPIYSQLKWSHGLLTPPVVETVYANYNGIDFLWQDNSGSGNAKADDISMVVVCNEEKKEIAYFMNGYTRSSSTTHCEFPDEWVGDHIHVYVTMRSTDGKLISNSHYCGEFLLE